MSILAIDHGQLAMPAEEEEKARPFFVNLLGPGTEWQPAASEHGVYEGRDRARGAVKWTATAVDLVFGSHSQLRAICEVYASTAAREKLVDRKSVWRKRGTGWKDVYERA